MDSYSKILSNFKLFSKTDVNASSSPITGIVSLNSNYLWITSFVIIAICAVLYYKKANLNLNSYFDGFLGKLWLGTHLTSAGELASTYVPTGFSPFSEGGVDSSH